MKVHTVLLFPVMLLAILCRPVVAETVVEAWRSDSGAFWQPESVSANPTDGSCWVADTGNSQVVHLSSVGAELWRSPTSVFWDPYFVAVNPTDGSCWLADEASGQVVHLSSAGAELWRSASPAFSEPSSISVNPTDGSCWVADIADDQVVHLSSVGAELWRSASGEFWDPYSVAANPTDGSCWVADTGNSQVVHLSSVGAELWRSPTSVFWDPYFVAVNPTDGSCWVADTGHNQVVHLSAAGAELCRSFSGAFAYPYSVSADPTDGSCWVADYQNNQVVHLSWDGAELWRSASGAFSEVHSVSVNPTDGSCWVADYANNQVVHLSPTVGFSGTPTVGPPPLTVQFLSRSTFTATSWAWSFGDGGTSTLENPTHTYRAIGAYTVNLAAADASQSGSATAPDYIRVGVAPLIPGEPVLLSCQGVPLYYDVEVGNAIPDLFVTLQQPENAWYATLTVYSGGTVVATVSGWGDQVLQLPAPAAGSYLIEVTGSGTGILTVAASLPEEVSALTLGEPVTVTAQGGVPLYYVLNLADAVPDLFVTLQELENAWGATLTVYSGTDVVATASGYNDQVLMLPALAAGYYLIEVAGSGGGILTAATSLPELVPGVWRTGTVAHNCGYFWYQLVVPAGETQLSLRLETVLFNGILVTQDSPNGPAVGEVTGCADTSLDIATPAPGTYFVRVFDHANLQGSTTQARDHMIQANFAPVEAPQGRGPQIVSISPTTGGTAGQVTVTIVGACLDSAATICLRQDGQADISPGYHIG